MRMTKMTLDKKQVACNRCGLIIDDLICIEENEYVCGYCYSDYVDENIDEGDEDDDA